MISTTPEDAPECPALAEPRSAEGRLRRLLPRMLGLNDRRDLFATFATPANETDLLRRYWPSHRSRERRSICRHRNASSSGTAWRGGYSGPRFAARPDACPLGDAGGAPSGGAFGALGGGSQADVLRADVTLPVRLTSAAVSGRGGPWTAAQRGHIAATDHASHPVEERRLQVVPPCTVRRRRSSGSRSATAQPV